MIISGDLFFSTVEYPVKYACNERINIFRDACAPAIRNSSPTWSRLTAVAPLCQPCIISGHGRRHHNEHYGQCPYKFGDVRHMT